MVAGLMLWIVPTLFPVGPLATLSLRLIEAGGFALSIAAGLGWLVLERLLPRRPYVDAVACLALIVMAWWSYPPKPLQPPRISTDQVIKQVLRVDRNLIQGSWMIVMEEPGYSLALGRGAHHYPAWFMENALIGRTGWCFEEGGIRKRGPQHVVLMAQHGQASTAALLAWIERHRDRFPLTQIADTPEVEVWWLQYETDKRLAFDQIWGQSSSSCNLDL
jgi:hypothetical protein